MNRSICIILVSMVTFAKVSNGQNIEYGFGKESDVVDSIRSGIQWYMRQYGKSDITKLNLYIGIDYCNGNLGLSISQYANEDTDMALLVKRSNRVIHVYNEYILPVLFYADVLTDGIRDTRSNMNMNGYYIVVRKNNRGVWKVQVTHLTF